jgi:xylulokinase
MIWLDRRAGAETEWMASLPDAGRLIDLVANPIDPAYIAPKILWLKKHHPKIYSASHSFLTSAGYMVYKLTGKLSCDYTQAYGYHFFDIRNERWDEKAADLIGVSLEKMPPLYQSCDIVGELTSKAAAALGLAAGVPVIAGGLDAAVGSFGAGVSRLGQTVDQGGQAGGMAMSVDKVIVEPRLIFSHHVVPGQYLFQSGTVGGGTLAWFKRNLGQWEVNAAQLLDCSSYHLMSMQVEKSSAGAHGLIFLPYMAGERSPIWNDNARGVFFGLSYKTDRADILRAIMEGCAFAVYHNMLIAEEKGGTVEEWIGVGGASRSDVWCQIKADVTGKPFALARGLNGEEGGHTLDLAVMVSKAVGLYEDLSERIDDLLPNRKVFEPAKAHHEMYKDLFEIYLELSNDLQNKFNWFAAKIARHQKFLGYHS